MWLTEKVGNCGSLAVVGLAKNAGKTETLNFILRELHNKRRLAVTSIGLDGESVDRVTATLKPEIRLYEDMLFATGETYYHSRRLESEILELGSMTSIMGRLVTARALTEGKVLLAGPSDTSSLASLIERFGNLGAETVVVDGALSRLSPASPAVTQAMILATGAALAPDIPTIVKKTEFVCRLIDLPLVDVRMRELLLPLKSGVWALDETAAEIFDLGVKSALELQKLKKDVFRHGKTLYVAGMIGDKLLQFLSSIPETKGSTLVCQDFTKVFVEPATLNAFLKRGGELKVLRRTDLVGVTLNPVSPYGYTLDSDTLRGRLEERLKVPVADIFRLEAS